MIDYLSSHFLVIALTFFVAGFVKGVAGMGLPTVAMGVLSAVIPPVSAASLLVIPSFVTNFWQLFTGPNFLGLLKKLWVMMLGILVGTLTGSWLLTSANTIYASVGLGATLILYAVHGLFAKPLSVPARLARLLSPVIGLTTGLINGGTGIFTLPAVPYLQALGLSKDNLIQAMGLSFTVSTIALAAGLARGGAFHLGNITLSALAIWGSEDYYEYTLYNYRVCDYAYSLLISGRKEKPQLPKDPKERDKLIAQLLKTGR